MKSAGVGFLGRPQLVAAVLGALVVPQQIQGDDPRVSNVRAEQRPGTQLVDIWYDLEDPDSDLLTITVEVSDNGGASYSVPASSFSGDVGTEVRPGRGKRIVWDAGKDWPGRFSVNMRFMVTAEDTAPPPPGMVLIRAGSFEMGDTFGALGDADYDEELLHSVYVSAFYMDRTEVTKAVWDEVRSWAVQHGYSFDNTGSGKASDHPVQSVSWYDCVKWCNARSEKEGKIPAYYTDSAHTQVYRTGKVDLENDWVKWEAGYRLPTEAEWEKAARGGLRAKRFPGGDTISHELANYHSYWVHGRPYYRYDVSSTEGYHPTYAVGEKPYTSPVRSFVANGYGLYDMAGNVWEWCWDWYTWDYYRSSPLSDPRGPSASSTRILRGGSWFNVAWDARLTCRNSTPPANVNDDRGFRSVLSAGQ